MTAPAGSPGRKVCIVFEEGPIVEGGTGRNFTVYLEGVTDEEREIAKGDPDAARESLSSATFWAMNCMGMIGQLLKETGAHRFTVTRR